MNLIPIPWIQLSLSALVAGGIVIVATPIVLKLATKWKLLDVPASTRRVHTRPMVRLGGVAVFLGIMLSLIIFFRLDPRLYGVFLGGTAFFILGLLDDLYNLPPPVKLLGQFTSATIPVMFGITITNLTNPLGGTILLAPVIDIILTLIWILLIVNTVNFLDGLDGLAGGVSAISAGILAVLSLFAIVNQPDVAIWASIVAAPSLGFLVYNWHPAKLFMGDSGSHLLGFMIATLAIISGGKVATAVLVLGLPIVDFAWSMIRRIKSGRAPWSADREHLHHLLLDLGLGQRTVVGLIYLLTFGFGLVALMSGTWLKLITLGIVILVLAGIVRLVLHFR